MHVALERSVSPIHPLLPSVFHVLLVIAALLQHLCPYFVKEELTPLRENNHARLWVMAVLLVAITLLLLLGPQSWMHPQCAQLVSTMSIILITSLILQAWQLVANPAHLVTSVQMATLSRLLALLDTIQTQLQILAQLTVLYVQQDLLVHTPINNRYHVLILLQTTTQ